MADATPARSDAASRDEELHPAEKQETPIAAFASLIGEVEETFCLADRLYHMRKQSAFRAVHDITYTAFCDSAWPMFDMIPEDDRDLVILAGFTSMYAEQLEDIAQQDAHAQRLAKSIYAALITITGVLARRSPGCTEAIGLLWGDLGRSIRRDVMATEIRRADMEALRHG